MEWMTGGSASYLTQASLAVLAYSALKSPTPSPAQALFFQVASAVAAISKSFSVSFFKLAVFG